MGKKAYTLLFGQHFVEKWLGCGEKSTFIEHCERSTREVLRSFEQVLSEKANRARVSDYASAEARQRHRSYQVGRQRVFLSSVLAGQVVGLQQVSESSWHLHFGPILLGALDAQRPELGVQDIAEDDDNE